VDPHGTTRGSIAATDFDYHQQEDRRVKCRRQFVNLQLTREKSCRQQSAVGKKMATDTLNHNS